MRARLLIGLVFCCGLALFWHCSNLDRNNPLDPKNPKSKRQGVVLVEAFVNDGTPFSPFALTALDVLPQLTDSLILILEYHVEANNFQDSYAFAGARNRYDFYEKQNKAVPDVFFNGSNQRVQGAASATTAQERFQAAYARERDGISHFTIEVRSELVAKTLKLEVSFTRLGENGVGSFLLQAVAYEDLKKSGHHHVVRHIWAPESFDSIAPGERKDLELISLLQNGDTAQNWKFVVFIQEDGNENKEIFHAVLVD